MKQPETFRQFQLTRRLTDLESLGVADPWHNEICFAYACDAYICIHSTDDLNGKCGEFSLILGNAIYHDTNLPNLEKMLFDYLVEQGDLTERTEQ